MERGFVKLWRKTIDSAVFADEHLFHLWAYCLMVANHRPMWFKVDGIAAPIRVDRGQFVTGRFSLHEGLFPKKFRRRGVKLPAPITVWRWLKVLSTMQNLSLSTNKRYSLVTINKYSLYNDKDVVNDHLDDPQMISRRSAGDQPVITNKNEKNEENEKNVKKKNGTDSDFPVALDTQDFQAAWEDWKAYRHEKRLRALTAKGSQAQLARLAAWGVDRAVAAIRHSMANEYQGIYEEKPDGHRPGKAKPSGSYDDRLRERPERTPF